MLSILSNCTLCPRNCKVNRLNNELGFCKAGKDIKVAKAFLHQWEEPCLTGKNGSGTVFFSNCNLKCIFCQNHRISHEGVGKEVSIERLSEIFIGLQEKCAHNINLVTPTHYIPQIIESIKIAKNNGLNIPIIYNTNSYENIETIKMLDGYVDIYLPDLKYFNDKYALKYSSAADYFKYASKSIYEMVAQVGNPQFSEDGIMKKGVIIRHLSLPGLLFDSKKIIDYIYSTFGNSVYLSIMSQYTPTYKTQEYSELNKVLNPKHYSSLIDYCLSLGIENAFIQEGETCLESFIPDFDLEGV